MHMFKLVVSIGVSNNKELACIIYFVCVCIHLIDCDRVCDDGQLSDDCTHCECGENLYGRVISGGIQLAGATISPVETPTAVIGQVIYDLALFEPEYTHNKF